MTITNTTRKATAVPNGSAGPFPYTFLLQSIADMHAYLVDPVTLAVTEYFQGTGTSQFQVTQNKDSSGKVIEGGSVTIGSALATLTAATSIQLLMLRTVDDKQQQKFPGGYAFPEGSVENALDKLTMRDIQNEEVLARALTLPVSAPAGFNATIPTLQANFGFKVNAAGNAIVQTLYDPDSAGVSAAAAAISQAAAANSATSALSSANTAIAYATSVTPIAGGYYGALYYAQQAAASAAAAALVSSGDFPTSTGFWDGVATYITTSFIPYNINRIDYRENKVWQEPGVDFTLVNGNQLTPAVKPAAGTRWSIKLVLTNGQTSTINPNANSVGAPQVIDASLPFAKLDPLAIASNALAILGASTNTLMTPASDNAVLAGLNLNKYYQTATPFTMALTSTYTLAHGLGREPTHINAFLVCTAADSGYAVGDRVMVNTYANSPAGGYGLTMMVDATNITLLTGNSAPIILNKTSRAQSAILLANWQIYLKAH